MNPNANPLYYRNSKLHSLDSRFLQKKATRQNSVFPYFMDVPFLSEVADDCVRLEVGDRDSIRSVVILTFFVNEESSHQIAKDLL